MLFLPPCSPAIHIYRERKGYTLRPALSLSRPTYQTMSVQETDPSKEAEKESAQDGDEQRAARDPHLSTRQECRAEAALVRSQCGPDKDPLLVSAESNTWCAILEHGHHISLRKLCALRQRLWVEFPWDPRYNTTRLNYNKAINVFPKIIVLARKVGDVVLALRWAIAHGLPFSVRGGRHSAEGFSLSSGMVIDLSHMHNLFVSKDARLVAIEAGALIGPTYLALQTGAQADDPRTRDHGPGGLIVPMGTCADVGVAGLTMGGGVGFLMRRWGLTCDNLLAAQVVLADGTIVKATSNGPHADLFWALRGGGGGNFGIVTRLVYRTHRLRHVLLFEARYKWQDAAAVGEAWQRWAPWAPKQLTSELALIPPTPLFTASDDETANKDKEEEEEKEDRENVQFSEGSVLITGEWASSALGLCDTAHGNDEAAAHARRKLEASWSRFLEILAHVQEQQHEKEKIEPVEPLVIWESSVLDAARHFTENNKRPPMSKIKSNFADALLPQRAWERLVERMEIAPRIHRRCPHTETAILYNVSMQAMGGAIDDVGPNETAFFHRSGTLFWIEYSTYWTSPLDRLPLTEWVTAVWGTLQPYLPGFAYVNFSDLALKDWKRAYWGPHLERLERVKARYDPHNRFCMPQSVPLPHSFPPLLSSS